MLYEARTGLWSGISRALGSLRDAFGLNVDEILGKTSTMLQTAVRDAYETTGGDLTWIGLPLLAGAALILSNLK